MLRVFGLLLLLAYSATAALAEEVPLSPETLAAMLTPSSGGATVLEYQADKYRSEGKITGCGVSFTYLFRDWAYRDNAPTVAYGSLVYFWEPPTEPYLALRLGVNDLVVVNDSITMERGNPYFSYIEINDKNLAGLESKVLRFQENHIIVTYYIDDTSMELYSAASNLEKLIISFNRKKVGSDLSHELNPENFTIENTELLRCLLELALEIRRSQ